MSIRVGIVMGSTSDQPVMQHASDTLTGLGVESQTRVLSAHRTPDALRDWVVDAEKRGVRVFIAGAGAAAHLPGVVASITTRPVIGVPLVAPNSVANRWERPAPRTRGSSPRRSSRSGTRSSPAGSG